MIKPAVLDPQEEATVVGRVFDVPLVVKGRTWLPLTQLVAWPIMAWVAKRRLSSRTWRQSLGVGALTMLIALGSEWCHNLAHAAAGWMIRKPMDAIRIIWGMPLLVYYDINDAGVTPQEHIFRALGGPVFNVLVLPFALMLRLVSPARSWLRDIANVAAATNIFLPLVGLLPIPGLDGGPILKWSLVERGQSVQDADRTVRKVNGLLGIVLALGGLFSFKKRRFVIGGLCVQLALIALSIALGIFKEQE